MNSVIHYVIHKDFYKNVLCFNKNVPNSCCHGKCQLKNDIKNSDDTGSNPISIPRFQNKENFVFNLDKTDLDFPENFNNKKSIFFVILIFNLIFIDLPTPPPK
jgi:hypothetical protein